LLNGSAAATRLILVGMIRFLNRQAALNLLILRRHSLFIAKRPYSRLLLLVLLLATLGLTSCAGAATAQNWPGLSTDGENLYVAYGPGVLGVEASSQALLWSYRPENASLLFYAPP